MLKLTLEEMMCDHPIKVKEDTTVGNVAHLLLRYRINGILVIDSSDEHKLEGVFTTTDLLRLVNEALDSSGHKTEELKRISALPVGSVCSKNVISLQKNESIVKVIVLMHHKNIHTIPVFDKERLVGVIGRHDILNVALS